MEIGTQTKNKQVKSSELRRLGTDTLLERNFANEDILPSSTRESLEEQFQVSWDKFYHVCYVLTIQLFVSS